MLPKNRLGRSLHRNFRIYESDASGNLVNMISEELNPFSESTSFTVNLDGPLLADTYYVISYVFGS